MDSIQTFHLVDRVLRHGKIPLHHPEELGKSDRFPSSKMDHCYISVLFALPTETWCWRGQLLVLSDSSCTESLLIHTLMTLCSFRNSEGV